MITTGQTRRNNWSSRLPRDLSTDGLYNRFQFNCELNCQAYVIDEPRTMSGGHGRGRTACEDKDKGEEAAGPAADESSVAVGFFGASVFSFRRNVGGALSRFEVCVRGIF